MIYHLVLAGAMSGVDMCAPFNARAAAIGRVHQISSTRYEVVYGASKLWHSGHLAYSYTRDRQSPLPTCYDGVIAYDGPRFAAGRNPASFAAIAAVYGRDAASDFKGAEFVSKIYIDQHTELSWYRGKKYGFTFASGSRQLTVKALDGFDADYLRATKP